VRDKPGSLHWPVETEAFRTQKPSDGSRPI